jgi:hypothetical protein
MIEILEGHWFNPDQIVSVKATGKDKCILWTAGQPATEGHVLEYSAEEVVQAIEDCYSEGEEEIEDE